MVLVILVIGTNLLNLISPKSNLLLIFDFKRGIYLFFLCCLAFVSQSQFLEDDMHFEHINEGLSQNTVTTILQDKYGFIWVGTWSGLNRFDGVEFKIYQRALSNPTSLGDNYIFDIYEDSKGDLWIGTRGGLSRYNLATDDLTPFRNDPDDLESFSGSAITKIYGDSRGDFWVGTEKKGLNLFNRESKKAKRFINNLIDLKSISNNYLSLFSNFIDRLYIVPVSINDLYNPYGRSPRL